MKKYIGKRIISFLIVLVGVSILSFLLIAWSGKDPAEIIAHRGVSNPTPEQIEMIRVEMGLDQPLPVRYIQWLSGMFTGELGTSLTTHQPIVKDLHKYLATTTSLVGMAILWIIALTVPISLLCARKRNRLFDQVTRGITICGICVPTFWLGFLLLTHDFATALQLGGNVLVMKEGKIIESGEVQSVFDHTTEPYTRSLIEAYSLSCAFTKGAES